MKKSMNCGIYVDDAIISWSGSNAIGDILTSLGIATEEQRNIFKLKDEGKVGYILGIRIEIISPKLAWLIRH